MTLKLELFNRHQLELSFQQQLIFAFLLDLPYEICLGVNILACSDIEADGSVSNLMTDLE